MLLSAISTFFFFKSTGTSLLVALFRFSSYLIYTATQEYFIIAKCNFFIILNRNLKTDLRTILKSTSTTTNRRHHFYLLETNFVRVKYALLKVIHFKRKDCIDDCDFSREKSLSTKPTKIKLNQRIKFGK